MLTKPLFFIFYCGIVFRSFSWCFKPNIVSPLIQLALSSKPLFQLWDTERQDGNISLVHSSSMRQFNWGYTQFSQFNPDDTLLLVSGVYLGPHHSSSGEIAVISLGRNVGKTPARLPVDAKWRFVLGLKWIRGRSFLTALKCLHIVH